MLPSMVIVCVRGMALYFSLPGSMSFARMASGTKNNESTTRGSENSLFIELLDLGRQKKCHPSASLVKLFFIFLQLTPSSLRFASEFGRVAPFSESQHAQTERELTLEGRVEVAMPQF